MKEDIFEKRKKAWAEVRKDGKKAYLNSRITTGLMFGLVITLLRTFQDSKQPGFELFSMSFFVSLLIGLLTFPVVFYLLGVYLWNRNEKMYGFNGEE